MKIKMFHPEKNHQRHGVRLYAKVESRSTPEKEHNVIYIRKAGMERWLCDCEAQLFIETGRRRNCDHIKAVRQASARRKAGK
jgi:hypothetical protein